MLPMVSNPSEITMTSVDFLNGYINPARVSNGQAAVAYKDFIARVIDETEKSHEEIFLMDSTGGRKRHVVNLDYDEMMLVGMRESKAVRKLVLEMLKKLASKSKPALPQTFAEALQLAADQAKQLELAAPKVAFVESLVERDNLMTATQVAQKHGKSAIWLNKILSEHDVYNKNVRRCRAFRQRFIDKGFGKMKQSEAGHDQALFTNAGEVWINELLIAHGYV